MTNNSTTDPPTTEDSSVPQTDTPRTDAAEMPLDRVDAIASRPACVVHADFARELEQELTESQAEVERLKQWKDTLIAHLMALEIYEQKHENDPALALASYGQWNFKHGEWEAQAEIERLTAALESCWHAANTYDGNYTAACDNVMHIVNATLKIANPEDK